MLHFKSTHLVFLAFAALLVALAAGCDGKDPAAARPSTRASSKAGASPRPTQRLGAVVATWLGQADEAAKAVSRCLETRSDGPGCRGHYLRLRRSIFASFACLRLTSELAAEVLLGPPRAGDEDGGVLAALDQAWEQVDTVESRKQSLRVGRAIELFLSENKRRRVLPAAAMQAVSDRSYVLGLQLAEADPAVARRADAVLADIRGSLEGILLLARTAAVSLSDDGPQKEDLAALDAAARPLMSALRGAKTSWDLVGRAGLVRATGRLGVAVRRLARSAGVALRLPYRARYPARQNRWDESIHALIVPARRRDLRPGNREAIAALGRQLFFDRRLSKGSKRACADCHRPSLAFSDGLAAPSSLQAGVVLRRNTPTLLYADMNAAQFWDGRVASPERQALGVIHNRAEMGLPPAALLARLSQEYAYRKAFAEAFVDGLQLANIGRALAAFQAVELVPAAAPIDRFGRSELKRLKSKQAAGFDLFVGKARCARCHIPPLFGGSRPRDFATPVYASLGVPVAAQSKKVDPDPGRMAVSGRRSDRGAFKTPTLRNVGRTAPYFHHGGFKTLRSVLRFYKRGGGRAMGLRVPNQDPDVRPLTLSRREEELLLRFMRVALSDVLPRTSLSTQPR